jgi:hypothetical protein
MNDYDAFHGYQGQGRLTPTRSRLAQMLMSQPVQGAPYKTGAAANILAEALNKGMAGYMMGEQFQLEAQRDTDLKKRRADYADTVNRAFDMGAGAPAGLDPKTGINWETARQPDPAALVRALGNNPDTAPLALQQQFRTMNDQEALARALALENLKQRGKAPDVETFFDGQGREVKRQWNPSTRTWDQVGGGKGNMAAPKIESFQQGDQTVYRQWNPQANRWDDVPGFGGPKWNPTERGGAPTLAQQANNQEIVAARKRLADEVATRNLTPQQLGTLSQQFDQNGLPNRNFNPVIARLLSQATQRQVGQDEGFEGAWQMFYGSRPPSDAAGEFGIQPGMLTDQLGQSSSSGAVGFPPGILTGTQNPPPGRLTGAIDLPMTNGRPDAGRLTDGQMYRLPNGGMGTYDAARRGFNVVGQ